MAHNIDSDLLSGHKSAAPMMTSVQVDPLTTVPSKLTPVALLLCMKFPSLYSC
ncbi:hypothetical protein D3C74_476820 [compost metagenome]